MVRWWATALAVALLSLGGMPRAGATPPPAALVMTVTPQPVQYSDRVRFEATVSPSEVGGQIATGVVQFAVDGTIIGTASVGFGGVAALNLTIRLTPGAHRVRANYTPTNTFVGPATLEATFVVAPEDATIAYTGQTGYRVNNATKLATVILQARVTDTGDDGYPGNLRDARVTFLDLRSDLPVPFGLPCEQVRGFPAGIPNVGLASCQVRLPVGTYPVRAVLGGGYGATDALATIVVLP